MAAENDAATTESRPSALSWESKLQNEYWRAETDVLSHASVKILSGSLKNNGTIAARKKKRLVAAKIFTNP